MGRASGRNSPLRGPLRQPGGSSAGQSIWRLQGQNQTLKGPTSESHFCLLRGQRQAGQRKRTRVRAEILRIRVDGGVRPLAPLLFLGPLSLHCGSCGEAEDMSHPGSNPLKEDGFNPSSFNTALPGQPDSPGLWISES